MQGKGSTARDVARWVALGALFLIPLTPLIVVNGFFFPFITGKAFYFRILVEAAVAAWVVLAFLDREYRPRFSWIGAAVVAFLFWMLVADAFAPNAAKAFWSNFERMEGWVLLVHLAGFFFAASAVLRVEKKWRAWFLASLAVSVAVSGYALLQLAGSLPIHQGSTRIDATLGNSAYLAIYLLFNVCIAGWLALTEKRAWLARSLLALALLEAVLIFFTETRGTVLGLVGALALAALLAALTAGKRARRVAAGSLALILILSGSFYLARESSFVQDNHVLQRIASISLSDGQVRFMVWHMAWEGFLVRPVTGWGQEGFNYVFDRFYDPGMYHQEPWFDRAHNAFIDWLVAGGAPGFLLFISLFASGIWFLWRRSELSRPERIALTAALIGYAVHELFVFDNLYSYVYFFAILALIDSQVARPIRPLENMAELGGAAGMTYAMPIAFIAGCALVWFVNVPGMRAASGLITAITPSVSGPAGNTAAFERLIANPGHAEQEIREQLVSYATSIVQSRSVPDDQKRTAVLLAIDEMKKQVARYPLDTRARLQLAYAYDAAGDSPDVLAAALGATKLSPSMEAVWLLAGEAAWRTGDERAAERYFDTAYELGPEFPDLASYAAAGAYIAGDAAKGDSILLKAYGTTTVDSDILAAVFYQARLWSRLIDLWKARAAAPGASAQTFFSLAAAYYAAGDDADAIATIRQTVANFPDTASAAAAAIKQIQSGPAAR